MVIPDDIAKAAAQLLTAHKEELGLEMAGEIGETLPAAFTAPYAAIYIDTVEESATHLTGANVMAVPFELFVQISSASLQTVAEASTQAWNIAFKSALLLINNAPTINGVIIPLKLRPLPFQILKKEASQTVIEIRLRFYLNKWD